MPPDLHLLQRYQSSADAHAFRELVQLHAGMVFATARRITRDASLAEDVAQETFLELARRPPAIRESIGGWLHRVARHRACNLVRAESRRREREAASTAVSGAPEATWEQLEPTIDAAIEELPTDLREPIVEHFLAGRTQQEVARRLGVSQSTVSRSLEAGIVLLRSTLQRQGVLAGAALALLLAERVQASAPAQLLASLGKIGLAGVGAKLAAQKTLAWASLWKLGGGVAVAVLAAGAYFFFVRAGAPFSDTAQDWNGRAFCPVCALPATKGRTPEQGIFIHKENGRDTIYDLEVAEPVADFHQRYCLPSMEDAEAVHVHGVVAQRAGRSTLVVARLELTANAPSLSPGKRP